MVELSQVGFVYTSYYYSMMSVHGLAMIFFLIMPMLIGGFGNLLFPILLGINDLLLPRLNALSLYLLYASLSLIFLASLVNSGINCGWTFYVPLATISPISIDFLFFSYLLLISINPFIILYYLSLLV